jgi:hypothetical protein
MALIDVGRENSFNLNHDRAARTKTISQVVALPRWVAMRVVAKKLNEKS